MLIKGTEGYLPIQKKTIRAASTAGAGKLRQADGRYDSCSLSAPEAQETSRSFLEAVSSLSYQVRTATTTGKIQELRSQVVSGEYQISPREVAARMLLMEGDE